MNPLAIKLRDIGNRIGPEIQKRRADRLTNTPKRALQDKAARIEADRLERTQKGLFALADAHEAGTCPKILAGLRTKKQVYDIMATKTSHPSYYQLFDTGEFYANDAEALALRELVNSRGLDSPLAKEERERRNRIADLEAQIRFQKIPGFFPTPPALVARLIDLADIQPGQKVLEPSAGKGDLAEAVRDKGAEVVCCEVVTALCNILSAKRFNVVDGDFIERFSTHDPIDLIGFIEPAMEQFDRVVMNPPFEGMQDLAHVVHAYKLLKVGGRLVSIMSPSGFFRQDKRAVEFREWLEGTANEVHEVEAGAFKNGFAPTGVAARIVVIDK